MAQGTLTDDIYWAHFPPVVQALRNVDFSSDKELHAAQLASQGYTIDGPIMVWNWDPVKVMSVRQSYGFTWVPSLLQPNIAVAPGVVQPGTPSYDPNNPPAGSIKVSTDAADYPPFVVPAPPAPPPSNMVGKCYGTVCTLGPGLATNYQDGFKFSENGSNYVLHVSTSWGGLLYRWVEKLS